MEQCNDSPCCNNTKNCTGPTNCSEKRISTFPQIFVFLTDTMNPGGKNTKGETIPYITVCDLKNNERIQKIILRLMNIINSNNSSHFIYWTKLNEY